MAAGQGINEASSSDLAIHCKAPKSASNAQKSAPGLALYSKCCKVLYGIKRLGKANVFLQLTSSAGLVRVSSSALMWARPLNDRKVFILSMRTKFDHQSRRTGNE